MRADHDKRGSIIKKSIIGLLVVVALVAVVWVWRYAIYGGSSDDTATDTTSKVDTTTAEDKTDTTDTTDDQATTEEEPTTDTQPTIDPALLTSIPITQMGIEVFYAKGIPGFEYQVMRASDGTRYVEFSSPDLVGTKCTDDGGAFVSIIENPSTSESQLMDATTKVGVDNYGLSLTGENCTADTDLLAEYQAAFKEGFSSLRAIGE